MTGEGSISLKINIEIIVDGDGTFFRYEIKDYKELEEQTQIDQNI